MGDPKRRVRRLYDHIAPVYPLIRPRTRLGPLMKRLDIRPGVCVLDCGTGPGVFALRLARKVRGVQVLGVDICQRFVGIARRRAQRRRLGNVFFTVGDLEALNFGDGMFDRLICVRALETVSDKVAAVRELVRVLKPGGKAVFAEPAKGVYPWKELGYLFWLAGVKMLSLGCRDLRGLGRREYAGEYFTVTSLESILREGGFSQVQLKTGVSLIIAVCTKELASGCAAGPRERA